MASEVDAVKAALEAEINRLYAKAHMAMTAVAEALEGWAKTEHRYKDRSGDNSGTIKGFVDEVSADAITVLLSAGMPYSEFLETARKGKWAFLMPVITNHEADIITLIEQVMAS